MLEPFVYMVWFQLGMTMRTAVYEALRLLKKGEKAVSVAKFTGLDKNTITKINKQGLVQNDVNVATSQILGIQLNKKLLIKYYPNLFLVIYFVCV